MTMRKVLALCCVLVMLFLSACSPKQQPQNPTTTEQTTTTTVTDDSAWNDSDWEDDFVSDDDWDDDYEDDDYEDDDYEDDYSAPEYVELLPESNPAQLLHPHSGGADKEAEELMNKVLNSETPDYNITGTTYYISPNGDDNNDGTSPETAWKTPDAITINNWMFEAGDAILFERGGVYRRNSPIVAKSGMTYGAYGEGYKPLLYGSATNYAWGANWEPSRRQYVWKITTYTREAGIMVFDHGKEVGMPYYYGVNELNKNGDFYHNVDEGTLYLYLDKGYPNVVYESIEVGTRENIFTLNDETSDVWIDNLALKYAGMFTFDVREYTDNTKFTNLEVGWVGGCRFGSSSVGLGNGVQWWQDSSNSLVENCWFYQVYDAGVSPQGINDPHTYENIVIRGNLIEFCNYSIEVFDRRKESIWDGLIIEDNIMRFAGYGFLLAHERPDKSNAVAHYVGWTWNYDEIPGRGIVIKNNIFDCSADNLVYWPGKDYESGVTVSGNSFYQKANRTNRAIHFGTAPAGLATNQAELEAAVSLFDKNPKEVKWIS